MTPNPDTSTDKPGRHRADDDPPAGQEPDQPFRDEEARPEAPAPATGATRAEPEKSPRTRTSHSVANHPAGFALLLSAGLVTGLALAPLLFDRLGFDIATDAARTARSAATSWPAGGEPWFWPSWVATVAALVAAAVLLLGIVGLRVPDLVVLALGAVLTVTTARAAWATLDVVNARLWELLPVCTVCVLAFGLAATATARWRSGDEGAGGAGGEAAGVAFGGWVVVALVLLAGAAIARSAETNAGGAAGPPQGEAGLLSVRSADGPQAADLRGSWAAQLSAVQVPEDDGIAATAAATRHAQLAAQHPAVLVRGDDVGAPDLDDTWWLTLADAGFGTEAEAATWCSSTGLPDCVPRLVGD